MQVIDITEYTLIEDANEVSSLVTHLRKEPYDRAVMFVAYPSITPGEYTIMVFDGEYSTKTAVSIEFVKAIWNSGKLIAMQIMQTILEARDGPGCEQHPADAIVPDYRSGYVRCMVCGKVLHG